jgi:D-3-phosphoglycerate dehydrogenase
MYRIQTLNKISSKGLDLLPREGYEVASELNNPDAVLVRSAKMNDMEIPATVKAIARAGAGVNNIPVDKCSEKGIVVFNTPGANANGVKELAIAALFISSRNIAPAIAWVKGFAEKSDDLGKAIEKGKSQFVGTEILGKKLGVIGLGAIGAGVANAAIGLGMEVTGYDPFISVEAAWGLSNSVKRARSLDSLFAESDYITIHVPLSDKTKGMINADKFAMMKKGVRIINLARGGLVNNQDLKAAIAEGVVACYVTDFPDQDLLKLDKVIPFPHLGASTDESEENCAVMAARQLKNFLETGNIVNSVNFPDCAMDSTGRTRLIIANKNVPNMIGQITTILAAQSINVADMINKHKGDVAYNIIDVDTAISGAQLDKIKAIEGIVMARVV